MRAVLDTNVLISALLSASGTPAGILRAWVDGAFELVVSAALLDEVGRTLAYPKIRKRVTEAEGTEFTDLLRQTAEMAADPGTPPPVRSSDRGDDFVIALAAAENAVIVSGDGHLLELSDDIPVYTPAEFVRLIEADDR